MSSKHDAAIAAAYQNKNYVECLALVKESLKLNPSSVNLKLMKAACGALLAVEFEENAEMLKQIIEADPKNGLAYYALGNCYYYEGEMGECIQYFKKAITLNSGAQKATQFKNKASIIMSSLCDADEKFERDEVFAAIEILHAVPLIDPMNKKIAEKIERIRQYYLEKVVKRLEASVKSEIEKRTSKENIAELAQQAEMLIEKKQIREAMVLIEKMEMVDPNAEAVLCLKGYAQYMAAQLKAAVESFDKAVKINPSNAKARKLLMNATKLDKLIEDAEDVSKNDADSDLAIKLYSEALTVDSNNSAVNQAIYLQRSFLYFKNFQFPTALDDFKKLQDSGITIDDVRKLIPCDKVNRRP